VNERPHLSIVIPAFNEERCIGASIARVLGHLDQREQASELVLVDDGSSDTTWQIIEAQARRDPRIVSVRLPHNRGKGAAVRAGIRCARGEVVVYFDADLAYALDDVDETIRRVEAGADLAIGARDLAAVRGRGYSFLRRAATVSFNWLTESLLGLGIPDTQCGLKAFRGEIAHALFDALTVERFTFDAELLMLARIWKLRVERVPVVMNPTAGTSVRVFADGLRMTRDVWRISRQARRGAYPPRPRL
jgi:glycosyltransferase involved in cell wall biosynthesis